MKKLFLMTVMTAAMIYPVLAEDFGVGLLLAIDNESEEYDDYYEKATSNVFEVGGSFYYFKDNGVDIDGGISYISMTYSDDDSLTDDIKDDYKRSGVRVWTGINKVILEQGIFSVGLGTTGSVTYLGTPSGDSLASYIDKQTWTEFDIAFPATCDISFTDHLMTRVHAEILTLSYAKNHIEYDNGTDYDYKYFDCYLDGNVGIDLIYKF